MTSSVFRLAIGSLALVFAGGAGFVIATDDVVGLRMNLSEQRRIYQSGGTPPPTYTPTPPTPPPTIVWLNCQAVHCSESSKVPPVWNAVNVLGFTCHKSLVL